jgi:serine/threonine-protein kinase RsbW
MKEVEAMSYPDAARFAIQLALDEALANAIRHGNGNDPSKTVHIEYSVDKDVFEISICDEGPGFNPQNVPDPTRDENLERPCGRGVMLIKAYMTEVHYNRKGNCLKMSKRRDCPLPSKSNH